jgi:hypothetical protein
MMRGEAVELARSTWWLRQIEIVVRSLVDPQGMQTWDDMVR